MKRGQAAGAAVLLAIIAAMIIGFVILIPPADRAELLADDSFAQARDDDLVGRLLKTNPGRIDYLPQRELEHPLGVVNVFTTTQSTVLGSKTSAYIKRGAFSQEDATLAFSVEDMPNTKNARLLLSATRGQGRLRVTLNDEVIYNSELIIGNLPEIPLTNLREDNLILLEMSSPGIAFWATHEAALNEVRVIADVTSIDSRESTQVFLVSETEKRNLEKVALRFHPTCTYGDLGNLQISINGNELYNAVPDCNLDVIPLEFSGDVVNQGENRISFRTSKGSYLLSNVVVESILSDVDFPTFYFDLSNEQYENVRDGDNSVRMQVDFVDVSERKRGDIVVNGRVARFDTKQLSFTMDISEEVDRGANAIKIRPKKTLEVRQIRVDLVR